MDPVPVGCKGPTSGNCYSTEIEQGEQKYAATIGARVLPSGDNGPIQRVANAGVGWIKKGISEILDLMSLGNPTDTVQDIQWWLQPSNQRRKAGAEGSLVYGALLGATNVHHLLPRQFARFFSRAGLNVEDYTLVMGTAAHRLRPGGLHTGKGEANWNGAWRAYFARSPDAGREQILEHLTKMRKDFGLSK
ncbi:MAG: DUF2380 domain-containing protein [Bryobacterales bacterium]|nr:DUF2380 domain-containing protein [Bryobacterales bacterium]